MTTPKLTKRQVEVLLAAYKASDGWIERRCSRIWGIAPTAVHALVKKELLAMPHDRGRARLTPAGRERIEAMIAEDPARFGVTKRPAA